MRTVLATLTAGLATITCLTAAGPTAQAQGRDQDEIRTPERFNLR
jgi:hypothetical protein